MRRVSQKENLDDTSPNKTFDHRTFTIKPQTQKSKNPKPKKGKVAPPPKPKVRKKPGPKPKVSHSTDEAKYSAYKSSQAAIASARSAAGREIGAAT